MQTQPFTISQRQGKNQYYEEPLTPNVRSLEMVRISAGTFLMGSPKGELKRSSNEGPQHQVTVSEFFMARYPVTQSQWQAVVAMSQVNQKLEVEPSRFQGDDRPVENVSWYDAVEFCDRISAHTHRIYRLPTEAEWEYACRAGTTTPFHFGETIITDLANYRGTDDKKLGVSGSYGPGPKGKYRQETTPVDHFDIANAFGLCDMHGNVWEWCQDHWHDSYKGAPADGSAWTKGGNSNRRVLRGGSWDFDPEICRSARRDYYGPEVRNDFIGFRVVSEPPRSLQ